jgi:hypothetical protein
VLRASNAGAGASEERVGAGRGRFRAVTFYEAEPLLLVLRTILERGGFIVELGARNATPKAKTGFALARDHQTTRWRRSH